MAEWKRTVKLKDLLSEDSSPATVRRVAREMSDRLMKLPDYIEGGIDDLSISVDVMRDIAESSPGEFASEHASLADQFNAAMAGVYDWADAERVWIA